MSERFYTRRFLNKRGHHAGAYILASVEDTSSEPDNEPTWADIEFTIADCGRQISLAFEARPGEFENSLHKIDLLVETLTKFRAALVAEGELEKLRAMKHRARKMAERAARPE